MVVAPFKPRRAPTIRWWQGAGPFNDAKLNALHHLLRYNFTVSGLNLTPPAGIELSKEDRMAIDYLVAAWGYVYHG